MDSRKGKIILTTGFFWKGKQPSSIDLKDCGFPLESPFETCLTGIYGYNSRLNGINAIKSHAALNSQNYSLIDIELDMGTSVDLTQIMTYPEYTARQILNMLNFSKTAKLNLYKRFIDPNTTFTSKEADIAFRKRPATLEKVINIAEFDPIKLMLIESEARLGCLKHAHMNIVKSAVSRTHSDLVINL